MALKPITISFKNTREDEILRDWICKHSNASGFIKDTLREVMSQSENIHHQEKQNENKNLISLGDF